MGVNSSPKTVTRQRRDCALNPGPSAPESSTLTTRLPSHPQKTVDTDNDIVPSDDKYCICRTTNPTGVDGRAVVRRNALRALASG